MELQIEPKFIPPTLSLNTTQGILRTTLKDYNRIVYREEMNEPIK